MFGAQECLTAFGALFLCYHNSNGLELRLKSFSIDRCALNTCRLNRCELITAKQAPFTVLYKMVVLLILYSFSLCKPPLVPGLTAQRGHTLFIEAKIQFIPKAVLWIRTIFDRILTFENGRIRNSELNKFLANFRPEFFLLKYQYCTGTLPYVLNGTGIFMNQKGKQPSFVNY
jgi:hypothetical protein